MCAPSVANDTMMLADTMIVASVSNCAILFSFVLFCYALSIYYRSAFVKSNL